MQDTNNFTNKYPVITRAAWKPSELIADIAPALHIPSFVLVTHVRTEPLILTALTFSPVHVKTAGKDKPVKLMHDEFCDKEEILLHASTDVPGLGLGYKQLLLVNCYCQLKVLLIILLFSLFLVVIYDRCCDIMEGFQALLDRFFIVIHAPASLRTTQKTLGHSLV
ncbi:hypothetical protein MAR_034040 [Mya arenaria]|uniref:Uncharacterized protein n=1 Tax=Mya arenaria TaxID=6604 RepID=A0ABY7GAS0_MYAAR|nr:hypothetical protein MAR_034040 [Mya arenaria]